MARPQLDEQERRARTVGVRVTAAEAAELRERAQAARLSMGAYLRRDGRGGAGAGAGGLAAGRGARGVGAALPGWSRRLGLNNSWARRLAKAAIR